jgi:hypothetical protein
MSHGHYIGFVTNITRKPEATEETGKLGDQSLIRGKIHVGQRHEVVCHPEIQDATIRVTAFQKVIETNGPIIYGHDSDNQNSRFIFCTTWNNHEFMLPVTTCAVYDRAVTGTELAVFLDAKYPLPAECHKCHQPLELV